MADEERVYLDHLIIRESLRYKRSDERMQPDPQSEQQTLRISDLLSDNKASRIRYLRKPDFQRASWAWTPADCVSLLESLVNDQVIPSIIMWSNTESGLDYVLDGAHRISVILAWLNDDWGDDLPDYYDSEMRSQVKTAAATVRDLVRRTIGSKATYEQAEESVTQIMEAGGAPKTDLDDATYKRGMFYRKLLKGGVGFHILWVSGDYHKAEQSFLKINKSGRQLSDWETKLVENRNSSFARTVMSVTSISSVAHYWPTPRAIEEPDAEMLSSKVPEIIEGIKKLHGVLFTPTYKSLVRSLRQPLLVAPDVYQKPFYLAEILTIIEGHKGQEPETEKLLQKDKNAEPGEIIQHGWSLVNDALDAFSHIAGSSPKSLGLVPALYFYTEAGRYVRSLLYGFLYWLLNGTDQEILTKKRLFASHRGAFEEMLIRYKEDVVTGITRKTGSGPEITVQTANYYQGLLDVLMRHKSQFQTSEFMSDYNALANKLANRRLRSTDIQDIKSRTFTEKQKSQVNLRTLFGAPILCGICEGRIDLEADVQHDHIMGHARGGPTAVENARPVHPFCNNPANREFIESVREGRASIPLPLMTAFDPTTGARQLNFFKDLDLDPD